MRSVAALVLFLVLCFGAGWVGSQFTMPSIPGWYAELNKPTWNPPNWVFAPVWNLLFLLMAISVWLVWRKADGAALAWAMVFFIVQLALNVTWSALFFGLQNPAAAFVEILILWCAILATTITFWRVRPVAGWLMLPYLGWVGYASFLNFSIWRMNS